jgi:hypothetical protein
MENLLIPIATAGSFGLALITSRFALNVLFRAMWVRAQSSAR